MGMDQMNWSMYVVFIIFPNFSVSGGWRVGCVIGGLETCFPFQVDGVLDLRMLSFRNLCFFSLLQMICG